MSSPGPYKVFIVEDNFMYAYVLEETLREYGNYKVTAFSSAEACIEMLGNNPHVIILDYSLDNGMNGAQAFDYIKNLKPAIPVIILSGQTDVKVAADLLKAGVFDYIEKKDKEKAMEKLQESIVKATRK